MNEQEFQDYISKIAATLPRRVLSPPDKQAVWMRVQNFIWQERLQADGFKKSHAGFWAAWRFSRAVAAALVVVLSLSVAGGVANASKGSLPGESLYPVKKAVEKMEIAIASAQGQEQKVQTLKLHAQTRLLEVTALVDENKSAPVVQESLKDLQTATEKVIVAAENNPELAYHAVEITREEEQVLAEVETRVEGEVKETVQKALTASRESLGKLESAETPAEEVKGAASETPTSTVATEKKPATTLPAKPKDGVIGSPIIIDGVTRTPGETGNDLPDLPSILDGSAIKF